MATLKYYDKEKNRWVLFDPDKAIIKLTEINNNGAYREDLFYKFNNDLYYYNGNTLVKLDQSTIFGNYTADDEGIVTIELEPGIQYQGQRAISYLNLSFSSGEANTVNYYGIIFTTSSNSFGWSIPDPNVVNVDIQWAVVEPVFQKGQTYMLTFMSSPSKEEGKNKYIGIWSTIGGENTNANT